MKKKLKTIDQAKVEAAVRLFQDNVISNVERLMKEWGIEKVQYLAEAAGINRATLYTVLQKVPAKRKNTKLKTLVALAMALEMDLLELLSAKEEDNG